MSKMAAIEFLKDQLASVENERKKVQAAMARLPQLDAEAQAIMLLLTKHSGETDKLPHSTQIAPYSANGGSVSNLVIRALTEAGKPQTTGQLIAFLASHGKQTTSATLRSTIYMKKNRPFKVISPGLYGLVEG